MSGAPHHLQTQDKIKRWHQTLKNRILLENHYLQGALDAQIGAFIDYYNHQRYREIIQNLIPADFYFGRAQSIISRRKRSNATPSPNDACNTKTPPLTLTTR